MPNFSPFPFSSLEGAPGCAGSPSFFYIFDSSRCDYAFSIHASRGGPLFSKPPQLSRQVVLSFRGSRPPFLSAQYGRGGFLFSFFSPCSLKSELPPEGAPEYRNPLQVPSFLLFLRRMVGLHGRFLLFGVQRMLGFSPHGTFVTSYLPHEVLLEAGWSLVGSFPPSPPNPPTVLPQRHTGPVLPLGSP